VLEFQKKLASFRERKLANAMSEAVELMGLAVDEIAKLKAIVDELPKAWRLNEAGELVQDVPVRKGMKVWRVWEGHMHVWWSPDGNEVRGFDYDGKLKLCEHGPFNGLGFAVDEPTAKAMAEKYAVLLGLKATRAD
jgi:hypothetical protein